MGFFFVQLCDISQTGNHRQGDLAKFDCRPDMMIKCFKNRFIFWLPVVEICQNKFNLKSDKLRSFFFQHVCMC
jgi:hypothetical protein